MAFAVGMLLSISFIVQSFAHTYRESMRFSTVNMVSGLVTDIRKQLAFDEDLMAIERFALPMARLVKNAPMVENIRILSDDMTILASPELRENGQKLPNAALRKAIKSGPEDARILTVNDQTHVVIPVRSEKGTILLYLLVSLPAGYLSRVQTMLWIKSLTAAIIALALASFISFILFRRYVETPLVAISEAFARIRDGQLDANIPEFETEEFSQAGHSISELFVNLRSTSESLQRLLRATEQQAQRIDRLLDQMSNSREKETGRIKRIQDTEKRLRGGIVEIETSVTRLLEFADASTSSVLELRSSVEEVDDQMGQLNRIIDDTMAKTSEMSENFTEVSSNTNQLAHESDELASAISEIVQSIQMIEQHAATNRDLSQRVTEHAAAGTTAINRSTEGMGKIKASVQEVNAVIQSLGERAQEIEGILKAINQIAEKTNLLALNAAIIAAQAGEHGKSFSVVADEIRELASQTRSSTRDIEEKMGSVQNETLLVVGKMRESLEQVNNGEARLNETVAALQAITASSQESDEMSRTIATATVEQATVSRQIGEVANRIQSYLHHIAQAMQSQEVNATQLSKSSGQIRDLTVAVQKLTQDQCDSIEKFNGQIEPVVQHTRHLNDINHQHGDEIGKLDNEMEELFTFIRQQYLHLEELNQQFVRLRQDADAISNNLRFLTHDGEKDNTTGGRNDRPART